MTIAESVVASVLVAGAIVLILTGHEWWAVGALIVACAIAEPA